MSEVYPDVSEWQAALSTAFTRRFVMCRLLNENGVLDAKIGESLPVAISMRAASQLDNFGGYVIPCIVPNATILAAIPSSFPTDAVLMIDLESWDGRVAGDHSADLTELANALRARQGGRADLIWLYSNRSDLDALYPTRPAWLTVWIEANYGPASLPADPFRKGWQYTDGKQNGTSMPSASEPFGVCDHNELLIPIPSPSGLSPDGGGTEISGGFMSDLSAGQQKQMYDWLKSMAANEGLNAAQKQHQYNVGAQTLAAANRAVANSSALTTQQKQHQYNLIVQTQTATAAMRSMLTASSSSADSAQLQAINSELAKLTKAAA